MRLINKYSVACALLAFLVFGVVFVYPPYRNYVPDAVVTAMIEEIIIPDFSLETRPGIEWTEGSRKFWRDHFPTVKFYGVENIDSQDRILFSLKKHLAETNIPELRIHFFAKRLSPTRPPADIRFAIVER